jgi:hypothetical protein
MDNHHCIHHTSHTNSTPDQHNIMHSRHTIHPNINCTSGMCLRALDLTRLHHIKPISSSLDHKALDTPRRHHTNRRSNLCHNVLKYSSLRPTNSSNSLYHKVPGYSRLHTNHTNSLNHTLAGLNRLLPPA